MALAKIRARAGPKTAIALLCLGGVHYMVNIDFLYQATRVSNNYSRSDLILPDPSRKL